MSINVPNVIERYYERFFAVDLAGRPGEDQYVYRHSNGLLVIGVAPGHPLLAKGRTVTRVDYNVTKQSRLANKVYGKGKKGALWLEPMSPLCDVTCSDGSKYRLYSCVRGHLLEVNENLVVRPELLSSRAATEGYLAIVSPKGRDADAATSMGLLSQEAYLAHLAARARAPLPTTASPTPTAPTSASGATAPF